jgi:hypothetical protein
MGHLRGATRLLAKNIVNVFEGLFKHVELFLPRLKRFQ